MLAGAWVTVLVSAVELDVFDLLEPLDVVSVTVEVTTLVDAFSGDSELFPAHPGRASSAVAVNVRAARREIAWCERTRISFVRLPTRAAIAL